MQACPETIYQAIYVQGRGQLRRELASAPAHWGEPCASLSAVARAAAPVSSMTAC